MPRQPSARCEIWIITTVGLNVGDPLHTPLTPLTLLTLLTFTTVLSSLSEMPLIDKLSTELLDLIFAEVKWSVAFLYTSRLN